MAKRTRRQAETSQPEETRRSSLTLPEDLDIKLCVWARKNRMHRHQALAVAVKQLTAGMRIGYGGADASEDGEAA
jgi:hypothetical protein